MYEKGLGIQDISEKLLLNKRAHLFFLQIVKSNSDFVIVYHLYIFNIDYVIHK